MGEGSLGFGPFEDHAFYPCLESPSVTVAKASEVFKHSDHSGSGLGGSPFGECGNEHPAKVKLGFFQVVQFIVLRYHEMW